MILKRVNALKLEPCRLRLAQCAEQARRIAAGVEKHGLEVRVEDNGVRLDPLRFSGVWSNFIHAIRNAVDHGIESPDARERAGKNASGLLVLRTLEAEGRVTIEIEDDGAGVDWIALRAKAARLGLPAITHADLENALFDDGVSTAAVVTDLSGRGVGMGALLDATRALGGNVRVESIRGEGTLLRLVFPDDSKIARRSSSAGGLGGLENHGYENFGD